MNRFKLRQITSWLENFQEYPDVLIRFFQYDSRAVGPGDLFFAIKGAKVDGHAFLEDVRDRGACAAVVSSEFQGKIEGLPLIVVGDVLASLQLLAQISFTQNPCKVIAITGSVGKTTTKEFIATLLEGRFRLSKTPGSVNSQVGLPTFLLNCAGTEELLVLEMGMNHAQEIKRLITMAPPDIAVVTRIALAHSAFFPEGIEGIAAAKAEIFSHPKTLLGILSTQAFQFPVFEQTGNFRKVTYGLEGEQGEYVLCRGQKEAEIFHLGTSLGTLKSPFKAVHMQENFLAACVVALELGLSLEEIREKAPLLKTCKNRFEIVEKEGITFLNDSYNANPTSMKAALLNLPEPGIDGKVIAVIGEMRELGNFSAKSHLEIGELALQKVSHLLCLGNDCQPMIELFSAANRPAELLVSLKEMEKRLFEVAKPGDVVLLKGSNSHQLWKLLGE